MLYGNNNPVEMLYFKSMNATDILHKEAWAYMTIRQSRLLDILFNLMMRRHGILLHSHKGKKAYKLNRPLLLQRINERL